MTTLLKLELIRLFSREAVNVLIRRTILDMNEFTPELLNQSVLKAEESGILMELALFGEKIRFSATASLSSFDGGYLSQMLNDVINGNLPHIDKNKLSIVHPKDYPKFALDFDVPDFELDL